MADKRDRMVIASRAIAGTPARQAVPVQGINLPAQVRISAAISAASRDGWRTEAARLGLSSAAAIDAIGEALSRGDPRARGLLEELATAHRRAWGGRRH